MKSFKGVSGAFFTLNFLYLPKHCQCKTNLQTLNSGGSVCPDPNQI